MKKNILVILALIMGYVNLNAQIEIPSYKDGLVFQAKDESFKAKLGFRIQNLVTVDFANNGNDTKANALVRRARLKLDGHVFSEKWVYKFEMGISNRDIGASSDYVQSNSASKLILDAVVKYKANKNFEFWLGQTKLPGNRERVISSSALQFVDRSLVNSYYNIDRDMGIQIHYKGNIASTVLKLKGSVSLGEGRNITRGNYGGFDYTGRLEFLPLGEFTKKGDYFSADLQREQQPKLALGVTFDFNDDASRQGGQLQKFVQDTTGNAFFTDLTSVFVDAIFKYKGFSFQAEYANKTGDERVENGEIDPALLFRTGSGLNLQMGYLLKSNFEFAARYTLISPDDFSSLSERTEYTLGISKYIVGHKLKIQTDFRMTEFASESELDPAFGWRFQLELGF